MVSLRGVLEEAPKSGFCVALNLKLPAGQMSVKSSADSVQSALRTAFDDLTQQLRKHKEHLRSTYRYPRLRGDERSRVEPTAAFESTVAAILPEKISTSDVTGFVNANLERLRGYVERELRQRRDQGQRKLAQVSVEEVIDEAVASALDEHRPRPEKMALEPWLYRLSRSAMDRLANQVDDSPVHLQEPETPKFPDVNDDEMRQYYVPDERVSHEDTIADRKASTPEDEASRMELMTMVERALRYATQDQREAFLLATLEGFRPSEIAAIMDRSVAQVEEDVRHARLHLRRSLQAAGEHRLKPAERSSWRTEQRV